MDYLNSNDFTFHGCDRSTLEAVEICNWYFKNSVPPAFELYQMDRLKEFIGAAHIPDIVHNVYGGHADIVTDNPRGLFKYITYYVSLTVNNILYV